MHNAFPETNFIFVCPPSVEELRRRLTKRGTDSEAQLEVRIKNAVGEISECISLSNVIHHRVVNDDLERATHNLITLIEALYSKELGL